MFGFLLFLGTLAFTPYAFVFVLAFYAFITRRGQINVVAKKNQGYIKGFILFLFLCTLNSLIHGFNGIPNMYMQVLTLLIAFSLRPEDTKWFIILTGIECVLGLYEYVIGVHSILPGVVDDALIQDEDLMYFKRVCGLCGNSSSFSYKILISSVLLVRLNLFEKKQTLLLAVALIIGFIVSFNRTAIISLLVFLFFVYFKEIRKRMSPVRFIFLGIMLIGVLLVLWNHYGSQLLLQFTRGNSDADSMLTGRTLIWASFGEFISNNFLFGNGSVHLLVPYYSGPIHAHNSFIQLLADHGIILFTFYLVNVFSRMTKESFLNCLPFIVVSMAQYVLFWGYTQNDVFFFCFLLNPFFHNTSKRNDVNTVVRYNPIVGHNNKKPVIIQK